MNKKEYVPPYVEVTKVGKDIFTASAEVTDGKDWGLGPVEP